jgi:STAM-binding protein
VEQLAAAAPVRDVNNMITLQLYYRTAGLLWQQVRTRSCWQCDSLVGMPRGAARLTRLTPPATRPPCPQAEAYRRPNNREQRYVMLLRFVRQAPAFAGERIPRLTACGGRSCALEPPPRSACSPPRPPRPAPPPPCSLVVETIPRHQDFIAASWDATYAGLRKRCVPALQELAALKAALALADPAALLQRAPYAPTPVPGAVQHSAGHVAGLHWDGATSAHVDVDVSALELLGSPEWAAAAAGPAAAAAAAPPPPPSPPPPAVQLPDLTSNLLLPAASQATLDKHAILPLALAPRPPASPPAQRPLYADLAAAVGGLTLSPAAAAALRPPSPLDGHLQLGPQELAVASAPHPTAPPPPGEACCAPPPPPPAGAPAGGLQEVKRRQRVRDVHISAALMDEFLRYALSNTRRNVETCGILAGSLSPDDARFDVTALIVPKQEGSSDMVCALAEEEIFQAQDSRALYPLGWVHTHPSQTCFLSSIDVHTQCGYQARRARLLLLLLRWAGLACSCRAAPAHLLG